jgi:hypothetical protein
MEFLLVKFIISMKVKIQMLLDIKFYLYHLVAEPNKQLLLALREPLQTYLFLIILHHN